MAGCRVDGNSRSERKKKSMFVAGHEFLRFSHSCPVFERRRKKIVRPKRRREESEGGSAVSGKTMSYEKFSRNPLLVSYTRYSYSE